MSGGRTLRIIVAGRMVAAPAQGGAIWAVLQWILGLRGMGHAVTFVEPWAPASDAPAPPLAATAQAAALESVGSRFGLARDLALVDRVRGMATGMTIPELDRRLAEADLLVDLSGVIGAWDEAMRIPVRLYVDVDPGFTQLWHAEGHDLGLAGHTHHATFGTAIGRPGSHFPTAGLDWIAVLPPVAVPWWPVSPGPRDGDLTTIANWRSYGTVERDGLRFGQKVHAFRELISLPRHVLDPVRVALAIDPAETADLALLAANGWRVEDPARVTGTPDDYAAFIRGSKAEIGIAKTGYTVRPTGWFSDRSACYLASGRPVIAQETGWSAVLPHGAGLLPFTCLEEAVEASRVIDGDYAHHAAAAASIAREHLAADVVLHGLLRAIGCA